MCFKIDVHLERAVLRLIITYGEYHTYIYGYNSGNGKSDALLERICVVYVYTFRHDAVIMMGWRE